MAGKRGFFITFEGSEGSGKSTQSGLLVAFLKEKGFRVLHLREPGGTSLSEKIRQLLLDRSSGGMTPECEMLLYMASRAQTVSEVIRPALKKRMIVVCDRFLDSTLAYQGYGLGVDLRLIREMGAFATGGLKPDLTFLMDVPVEQGLCHRGTKDRIEQRSLEYHRRVRKGYLALAGKEPARMKVIKVRVRKQETQGAIRTIVLQQLSKVVGHSNAFL
jgi:dTMP kinase